jgi:glucose 1-dehydrogenase
LQSSPAPLRASGSPARNAFLAEGARVVLSDVKAEKLCASGNRLGAKFVVADASLKADVDLLTRRTIEIYGRIDILVSNAGITILAEFLDVTEEEFDRVLRINLKSLFLCTVKRPPARWSAKAKAA